MSWKSHFFSLWYSGDALHFAAPPLLYSFTVGQKSAWYSRDCQLFFPLSSFLCTLSSPLSPSALSWIPFVPPLRATLHLHPLLFLHPGDLFMVARLHLRLAVLCLYQVMAAELLRM